MGVALELEDIQGAVLRGYRLPLARYVFLRVERAARARRWLAEVAEVVTTAAPWEAKPAWALNVSLSFPGLSALGVDRRSLDSFPAEFREGMAARAGLLGDTGPSAPGQWEPALRGELHAMVMISAADPVAMDEAAGALAARLDDAGGLRVVAVQHARALDGAREHFGFADGFGQPSVEGAGGDERPGQGAIDGSGWRPIRAGEFVLGYPDEEGVPPEAPAPGALSRNGTFLVYRKLRQDVAGFRAMLASAARHFGGDERLVAAKLVGRWPDGTPLALSPEREDPALAADERRNTDFRYGADMAGLRCPVGAHIRRANPRDGLIFPQLVNRHRMLRRGITYGDPLPPGAPDDGADRGVIFMCLQASIARQFEFVQSQWMNDGNGLRLGDDRDVLVGDHDGTGKMTVPGRPPRFVGPLARMVTLRGGGYFFTPGIGGLRHLAGGRS